MPHFRSLYFIVSLACIGCQSSHDTDSPDVGGLSPTPVESNFVRYRYQWSEEGVTRTSDGGWSVRSDLGYDVHVDAAWIVTYSTSLVACMDQQALMEIRPWYRRLYDALAEGIVGTAYAGHDDIADPSTLPDSFVEAIGGPDRVMRVGPLPPKAYCDAHYLVARGDANSIELEGAPYMDGLSIEMRGTWRRTPDESATPFTISSEIAFGVLHSTQFESTSYLQANPLLIEAEKPGQEVLLVRPMRDLFKGVEFNRLEGRSLARKVLYNFAATEFIFQHADRP